MTNPINVLLNSKFRNKLIFMCITTIVPTVLAGVFLLWNLADTMRTNAENEIISSADSLKIRLKDSIVTVSNISERAADNTAIKNLLQNNFVTSDEYYDFYLQTAAIDDILNTYPQISEITYYINKEGFVNYNSFYKVTTEIENTYWYMDAKQYRQPRWQIILDKDTDTYSLCLVTPLFSAEGTFKGVMNVTVNPDTFALLCDELPSSYKTIFSVGQSIVFHSTVNEFPAGKVIPEMEGKFLYGVSDSDIISGNTSIGKLGHVVVSYFDYENTGNLFQVYIVSPASLFSDETNKVVFNYIWYVFLCILLSVLIAYLFSSVFSRRIQLLQDQMHNVAAGDFELTEEIKGTDEIFDLYEDLKKMVDSMQTLINDAYKAKIQSESFKLNQAEAEFKALASQINPHFLYNTLETIRMKAYVNNDKETADLVKKLGKFMRRCLEVKDGMVTLESELEFTRSYLELQSARFGDRVSYKIYCEVDRNYKILPLIIQPIVENAFVHGIEGAKSNGKININVFYRGENVVIEVSDNGSGISPEKLRMLLAKLKENDTSSGKSIGLTNVNKRIKMYHGEQYGMSVETVLGQGTTIRLTIPREVDENVMKRLPEKYMEISGNISAKHNKEG
ncbi:MAG: sensor histidine kinase [Oscillospiraceae bacterium]|nr:sensor histidine kinase [Oscillospiraceae bacterium]